MGAGHDPAGDLGLLRFGLLFPVFAGHRRTLLSVFGMPPSSPRPERQLFRLHEPVGLHTPWTLDFDALSFEWRRLFGEALGTFFLVLVAAGGGVVNARSPGQVPLDTAAWSLQG